MLLADYKPVFVCAFSNPLTWNMQTCIDCTCLKFPHCVCSVHCLIFLTSTALLWPQHSFMTMKLPQNYFRTWILVFSLEDLLFFWTFETIQMVSRVCSEDYRLHHVARFCFILADLSPAAEVAAAQDEWLCDTCPLSATLWKQNNCQYFPLFLEM